MAAGMDRRVHEFVEGHDPVRRNLGPLSEVRPSELNRRRSQASDVVRGPTKQFAHSASRPGTEPLQSTTDHNGGIPTPLPDPLHGMDDVRRILWPQQDRIASPSSGPSRMPSSANRATSQSLQDHGYVPSHDRRMRPSRSVGPSTSLAAISAPSRAVPFTSVPRNPRISLPSDSLQETPTGSMGLHSHRRHPGSARPAGLNTGVISTPALRAPTSHRRSSQRSETVTNVSRTSSVYPAERSQLKEDSKSSLQSGRRPMMPSILYSSEEESDSSPQPRSNMLDMFHTEGPDLPGSEIDSTSSEEIQKLFQNMPEIEIPPEDRANTPVQMSCKLMEHQKVALKWLIDQEKTPNKKGGLLADTMGLGKTIEALALIVAHRPPPSGPKTTLVVAPLALLRQWNREIAEKIKPAHKLTTFIYHGREKKTKKADRLYSYDIVITTYETIAFEYKKVEPNGTRKSPLFTNTRGFYRIVLDEAHKIKNRNAWCSKAVTELRAQYRLCMTGTPFMNNTGEIFSLVRFLQISPYNNWTHFNHYIEQPLRSSKEDEKAVAIVRLQVLFRSITLRRTKDSVLDGKPILTLPELTITPLAVEFDEEQRAYYNAIEHKHQILVNKYLKRGRLSKVFTYILVLLTRLRQTCDHPYLIKSHGIPNEARLNGKQMVRLAMRLDEAVVDRIKRTKVFHCPLCDEAIEMPIIIFPCGHDICPDCFSTMMKCGIEAAKTSEQSQAGLIGFLGGAGDLETKCPHQGCDSEIVGNKVICHDFFLDAHNPESPSQLQEEDSSEDESDDCCTTDEDEGDESEDEGSDLQDFIVSDGEGNSDVDGLESDINDAGDNESSKRTIVRKLKYGKGRSSVDRATTPDAFVKSAEEESGRTAGQMNDGPIKAEEREDEAEDSSEDSKPCLARPLSPEPKVEDDAQSVKSPTDQPSRFDQGASATVSDHSPPQLGNDLWGRLLTRYREEKHTKPDTDSDSDLESLSGLAATSKCKSATPAIAPPEQRAPKRKRGIKSEKFPKHKKRVKLERDVEPDRESGKARKKDKKKSKKGHGKTLAELKKIGSSSKAAKAKYFNRLRRDWESSAKVDVTLNLLRKIRNEKPGEKTLVFSLWTSFLDLLEIPLQDEKFRYLRYDGAMTFKERDDNVRAFSEDRHENLLLVSLMAGNAGLNLTAASQVIILEPFWNPFVEDQAVDRAHRIGQSKAVQVHKLLVPDSVEDRIMALQDKKRSLVNTALSEEGAQGAGRLSIRELRSLFGLR